MSEIPNQSCCRFCCRCRWPTRADWCFYHTDTSSTFERPAAWWSHTSSSLNYFILYRVLIATYFSVWLIICWLSNLIEEHQNTNSVWKWFIYVTCWTFTIFTAYLIVAAVNCVHFHWARVVRRAHQDLCRRESNINSEITLKKRVAHRFALQWLLLNISVCGEPVIALVYWCMLYPARTTPLSPLAFVGTLHVHALGAVVALVDLFCVRVPVRWPHLLHAVTYAVVYLLFNILYVCAIGATNDAGEPYIYSILNWHGAPTSATLTALGVVVLGMPLGWLLAWGVFQLRQRFVRRRRRQQRLRQSTTNTIAVEDIQISTEGHNNNSSGGGDTTKEGKVAQELLLEKNIQNDNEIVRTSHHENNNAAEAAQRTGNVV